MEINNYSPNMEIVMRHGKIGLTECNQVELLRWFKYNRPDLWDRIGEE